MLTPDDLKAIGALMDEKLQRQKTEILAEVDVKLENQKNDVITAVSDHFADSVLPPLEKHDHQIEDLQQHTTHPPGAPANV